MTKYEKLIGAGLVAVLLVSIATLVFVLVDRQEESAVIIDDEPVLYPKVTSPDIFVIMSQEGFEKYGVQATARAVMLIDSSLVHSRPSCRCIGVPATREARENLGREIVANIVMLGALVAATAVVSKEAMEKAILDSVPKGTESLNLKAMKKGFELAEQEKHG